VTASRQFPAAMPKDVSAEPAVVKLTRNAAAKIAGQNRTPNRSSVTMAIPVGGQKGLALGCTVARRRLSFAAKTYVVPAARPTSNCFSRCERHTLDFLSIRAGEGRRVCLGNWRWDLSVRH